MAKTLEDLFGHFAYFEDDTLGIIQSGMADKLGIDYQDLPANPTPEQLAATLLLVMDAGTKLPVDEDGFIIPGSHQAIVTPNREPRKTFVTINGGKMIRTTLTFDIYTQDTSNYAPSNLTESNSGNQI